MNPAPVCRKCIYEKLSDEEVDCCPVYNIDLGCLPVEKLRPDHNLQDIRAKIFPFKRRKIEAPEVLSSISLPTKRKERSLSSLAVNAPKVSMQTAFTGKRTKRKVDWPYNSPPHNPPSSQPIFDLPPPLPVNTIDSLCAPFPKLPKLDWPYRNPETLLIDQSTSWAETKRNFSLLFLEDQPEPTTDRPHIPPPEYQFQPIPTPLKSVLIPYPYESTEPTPSEITNEHGPLLIHLVQKRLPPKKIYPSWVIYDWKFRSCTQGVLRHVIPPWETKIRSDTYIIKRARGHDEEEQKIKIFPVQLKYGPINPEELGSYADPMDNIMYHVAQGEVFMAPSVKNKSFLPPTWFKTSKSTKVGVIPDRVCPKLPMLDLNKNKDPRQYRKKIVMPTPSKFDPKFGRNSMDADDIPIILAMSQVGEAFDAEAMAFWSYHMWKCEQEASTSGLSLEDKAKVPTVKGQFKQKDMLFMILDDICRAPIKFTIVLCDCETTWDEWEQEKGLVVYKPEQEHSEMDKQQDISDRLVPLQVLHPICQAEPSVALSTVQGQAENNDNTVESQHVFAPPALLTPKMKAYPKAYIKASVDHAMANMLSEMGALMRAYFSSGPPYPPPPPS